MDNEMKIRDIVRPLLQEIYQSDGWKMLTCCMLLNLTNRRQVDVIRDELKDRGVDDIYESENEKNTDNDVALEEIKETEEIEESQSDDNTESGSANKKED